MKSLDVDPRARAEIDSALAASIARSPARAAVFRRTIDAALATITANPQVAAVVNRRGDRRYILDKRFPYSVVYLEETTVIRVIAFPHHKRRTGYWTRRLRRP